MEIYRSQVNKEEHFFFFSLGDICILKAINTHVTSVLFMNNKPQGAKNAPYFKSRHVEK